MLQVLQRIGVTNLPNRSLKRASETFHPSAFESGRWYDEVHYGRVPLHDLGRRGGADEQISAEIGRLIDRLVEQKVRQILHDEYRIRP